MFSQFSSVSQSCLTLCDPMDCSMPGPTVHHQLLEFTQNMSIESVMPSNHLIICCPLLLLPSVFPSIGVFSNESTLRIRWPKYWSFSFNINPSGEHPGLISFNIYFISLMKSGGSENLNGILIQNAWECWLKYNKYYRHHSLKVSFVMTQSKKGMESRNTWELMPELCWGQTWGWQRWD